MSTDAVLVKKKGRGILPILRPFPVGKYIHFILLYRKQTLRSAFFSYETRLLPRTRRYELQSNVMSLLRKRFDTIALYLQTVPKAQHNLA